MEGLSIELSEAVRAFVASPKARETKSNINRTARQIATLTQNPEDV